MNDMRLASSNVHAARQRVAGVLLAGATASIVALFALPGCARRGAPAVDVEPVLVYGARPEYPPEARSRGIEGDVVVELVIAATGQVERARVATGPTILHEAALAAAYEMRFTPARIDDRPVPRKATQVIGFRLDEDAASFDTTLAMRAALSWQAAWGHVEGDREHWDGLLAHLRTRPRYDGGVPTDNDIRRRKVTIYRDVRAARDSTSAAVRNAGALWRRLHGRRSGDSEERRTTPDDLYAELAALVARPPLDRHVARWIADGNDVEIAMRLFLAPDGGVERIVVEDSSSAMSESMHAAIAELMSRGGFAATGVPQCLRVRRVIPASMFSE